MSYPFRLYGHQPSVVPDAENRFVDLQLARAPTSAEKAAIAERWVAATGTGASIRERYWEWSDRFALLWVWPPSGGRAWEGAMVAFLQRVAEVVPVVDARFLDALDGTGSWDAWSRLTSPPDPGPAWEVNAPCPQHARAVDPRLPPPARDLEFEAAIVSARQAATAASALAFAAAPGALLGLRATACSASEPVDTVAGFMVPAPLQQHHRGPDGSTWVDRNALSRRPGGATVLVGSRNEVWEVDPETGPTRRVYLPGTDDSGLEDLAWLDEEHFAVHVGGAVRVIRHPAGQVASSVPLQGRSSGARLHVALGGRIILVTRRAGDACWEGDGSVVVLGHHRGRAELLGALPFDLAYAGEQDGVVLLRSGAAMFELTGLPAEPPPDPEPGLSLGRVETRPDPVPAELTAPFSAGEVVVGASGRAVAVPLGSDGVPWGLEVLGDDGVVFRLTDAVAAALAPDAPRRVSHVAVAPSGRQVFVVAGQGPLGLRATVLVADVASREVALVHAHDGEAHGKVVGLHARSDDDLVVVSARSVRRLEAPTWEVAASRKLSRATAAAGQERDGRTLLAVATEKEQVVLLTVSPKNGRFSSVGELATKATAVTFSGRRLLVRDAARRWWPAEGI